MEYFQNKLKRRKTRLVTLGKIKVGSEAPITVQSMTNTVTHNLEKTLKQIVALEKAGADLIRVSCPDESSTKALKKIVGKAKVPIIADIHFHSQRAIEAAEAGAACLRINPGNIGNIEKIKSVVDAAKKNNCAIRIGVNAGSLEKEFIDKYYRATPEAMLASALKHVKILESLKFYNTKISVKASNVQLAIDSYKLLAKATNYPLHLGITEAGSLITGTVKSSIGIGSLLNEGIGDTIRVSLSDDPINEVRVGIDILNALGIRKSGLTIISCPSCARQQFDVIETVKKIEHKYSGIKKHISISILGCVVNGPGEAKHVDLGVTGGGNNNHQIYLNGKKSFISKNQDLTKVLSDLIEENLKNE
ncbi:MAG: flavodoxin-dependent (E)-4-hydroxy-3-methylbut-2-enyl-diphosphate synthase [Alphaproteobacteria bacterium TMED93]|nr:MAG: flavodoxin-dependent (E)-4-hydroxy-3-methylbut-2-enyl-diphosphate synthase [Alphaproteobacteria bacterium TMED93]|tara:strand:- start:540 stop:1625 length:1086 start_codon:yes stop_codon:yes gene_type:complete